MRIEEIISFTFGVVLTIAVLGLAIVVLAPRLQEEDPEPKIIEVTLYDCSEQTEAQLLKTK